MVKVCEWSASCWCKTFYVFNVNDGVRLFAREDEGLEKIVFDPEKKKLTVSVRNPIVSAEVQRDIDLSDAPEFFEELRKNLEAVMTSNGGTYKSVTTNAARTVFEVS